MSWVTVGWSMIAAVCMSFAAVHALVWLHSRDKLANLLFAISAFAAGVLTVIEMVAMRAATPAAYSEALRWMHVAAAIIVIALVWFVRAYLQAGRLWLAWTIVGLRALVLVANFFVYPNGTFVEISALKMMPFLGETLSAPVGEQAPSRILIFIGHLLFLIYATDAAVQAWRRGARRQSVTVGGTIVVGLILGLVFSQLMVRGYLPAPLVGFVFLMLVVPMGWELSRDVIQAGALADRLRLSQQRMEMATRAGDLGLWEWDIVRDEVWANERARAWVGAAESERMSFESILQRIASEYREATREAVQRALSADADLEVEFRIDAPGDDARWIAAHGRVERRANGKPVRMRGISMDITARRRDEAELLAQRDSLAQLHRATSLGQLSNALAHELSQPLGAILRNSEAAQLFLKKERPDLEELRAINEDIMRDDRRASAVIDRMRALLKRRSLEMDAISLRDLVDGVAAMMRGELLARQAVLKVDVPSHLPYALGDRVHLQQVILNLLLNSLEAVGEFSSDRRTLTVRATACDDGWIEVAVSDLGPGFPPARISQVFDSFMTTKCEGTGLGLAISKTIVDSHGGRIWAENDPQGGATVRFTLRAVREGGGQ